MGGALFDEGNRLITNEGHVLLLLLLECFCCCDFAEAGVFVISKERRLCVIVVRNFRSDKASSCEIVPMAFAGTDKKFIRFTTTMQKSECALLELIRFGSRIDHRATSPVSRYLRAGSRCSQISYSFVSIDLEGTCFVLLWELKLSIKSVQIFNTTGSEPVEAKTD